ncbi:MAG: chorismate mutase [Pseudomonadota bacterium]|nr:chorismate mutase [Pseudomonadota bacterium]
MNYKNMEELRKDLDILDEELLKIISKRFKFIEQAAIIKNDASEIRDNERIEEIILRLKGLAKNYDISSDIVEKLWRFIIDLSIEYEKEIFSQKK